MIRPDDGVALIAVVVKDGEAVAQIVDPNDGGLAFFQLNFFAPAAAHIFVKSLNFKLIYPIAEQEHPTFEFSDHIIGHIVAQRQFFGYYTERSYISHASGECGGSVPGAQPGELG